MGQIVVLASCFVESVVALVMVERHMLGSAVAVAHVVEGAVEIVVAVKGGWRNLVEVVGFETEVVAGSDVVGLRLSSWMASIHLLALANVIAARLAPVVEMMIGVAGGVFRQVSHKLDWSVLAVGIGWLATRMMLVDGLLTGLVVGKADNCPEIDLLMAVMYVVRMAFEIAAVVS